MNDNVLSKWKFVAGPLCLEFTNTVDARLEQKVKNSVVFTIGRDKLNGYLDLVDWAKEIEILDETVANRLIRFAKQNEKESKQNFDRAITLRESLFRIFKHIIEGWEPPEADVELLNRESAEARSRQKLIYESNKFVWKLDTEADELGSIIWSVVLSGNELLLSEQITRVRQCPGENCGWLFLDVSKNKSRQWCDMKDCGNLAKVRSYRERQK
ncbi:MAG: CGNR zinc finger domain-containing protein [Bacteroidetes bacterium]|nr:CGNR zinc finger domain-containing protein [Bacteroidota bacterium]